jgi:hypothetical protein
MTAHTGSMKVIPALHRRARYDDLASLAERARMRTTSNVFFACIAALLVAAFAAPLAAGDVPSFLIESFQVTGGSRAADRIVIAESRLVAGQTYDETQLRDAMARIQRLPFIVSTNFRLAKGTAPGTYVLVIAIRRMSALFIDAEQTSTWSPTFAGFEAAPGGFRTVEVVRRFDDRRLVAGFRTFAGANNVIAGTAERVSYRNDRYTLTFSSYDLFGTRASITALASYLSDPGANRSGDPSARNDWHHRDDLTWEVVGVIPVTGADSLRVSWQHSEYPSKFNEFSPETGRSHYTLLSSPQIEKQFFWIHDTTNDPLLPTRGTRWSVGNIHFDDVATAPTFASRFQHREKLVTLEHSQPITERQSVTLGADGKEFDHVVRNYRAFGVYAFDLSRLARSGDARLELGARWELARGPGFRVRQAAVNASGVYRNVWGVLRFTVEYYGWEKQ